ncbi:unnamed protein product [Plutella xylostella]|uniref:(diamondback moth) hypothetical protein n=1 Tax=Plutella xylostella TaxID=51655 RepID=A0A8S4ESQ0_PLUXY|nr:unnamed protein product [Plutella xylostella]
MYLPGDHETNGNVPEPVDVLENGTNDVLDTEEPSQEPVTVPELDPETLSALGETTEKAPKFGANIHESLSRLWLPILRKGINNETKEKLAKEYLVPENCALLQPPKLNPEITSAVNEGARARDKKVEAVQQQLGLGITALNKGLELLLDDGRDRLQAIKYLSDSCRLLCDLHFLETEARKKFITPGLDKSFLNIMQDVEHDDMLFGNKLSEKIKATKVIEKHGLQIKKPAPNPKPPSTSYNQPSTSRSRPQGNWGGPSRFAPNRGGRGGAEEDSVSQPETSSRLQCSTEVVNTEQTACNVPTTIEVHAGRLQEPEVQILDYMTQQHKLFIGISAAHALRISANRLWDTLNEVSDQIEQGNLERLPELHALACCLKAVSTADTAALVERCRLACGGHGYMLSSNLPLTYGLVTAACTYEGENTVLLLQTARFLMKTWQQIDTAKTTPTIEYLKITSDPNYVNKWEKSVEGIIRGFQVVAMRKTSKSFEMMKSRMLSGMSQADAWNMTSVQLVAAAEAHCRAVMLQAYHEATAAEAASSSPELRPVLQQLLELYAAYWALEKTSDLLQYTPITGDDITELQIWYEELLTKIRPNAVGLVDAFDIRDDILQSTLGAYDGRVYERLFEEAQKAPLNAEPVNQSFHQHLKPFMQGKL